MPKTAFEKQLHRILEFTNNQHEIRDVEEYRISHESCEEQWEQLWDSVKDTTDANTCAENILTAAKDYGFSAYIYAFSFLVKKQGDSALFLRFLRAVEAEGNVAWGLKYRLCGQIQNMMVTGLSFRGTKAKLLSGEIYKQCVHLAKADFAKQGIAPEKWGLPSGGKLVIVAISQFLGISYHGPTKTILDRCLTLIKRMGKSVLLVNTAELLGGAEAFYTPVYRKMLPSYVDTYLNVSQIDYEGVSIPFFQCPYHMPDLLVINELLAYFKKLQPAYLIHIGGGSIFTEIASDFLPTLTIATAPSDLAMTLGQLQVIGRKLQAEDYGLLKARGKDAAHVIEGRFTWSLKPQEQHFTRESLGFLTDDFCCAIVGVRLDMEASEEFVSMLLSIEDKQVKFVWIGNMGEAYERYCNSREGFRGRSYPLGSVEDVLAVLECCDVYVNPIRLGGGTSVIEAMHQGLPAVTTAYGDVALGAGADFQVADYGEMAKEILRLKSDCGYYRKKSAMAKARAAEMLDTDTAFAEIIEEAERRMFGAGE